MDNFSLINRHYEQDELSQKVLAALTSAGKNIEALTLDDLSLFDEFHIGGRHQTRELAQVAGLQKGMHVLDVGCGVGGPARTLAAEFGCTVTGIDLSAEFCQVATMLSARVGLSKQNKFHPGNALEIPFADETFDVVWTQHASMNVKDKKSLYKQMRRVLRPQGKLALQDIMGGPVPGLHFPVFWASDPLISFLAAPEEIRQILAAEGFQEIIWNDLTERAIQLVNKRNNAMIKGDVPPLDIRVIVADGVHEKTKNMLRNLEEGRMIVVQAVFERV